MEIGNFNDFLNETSTDKTEITFTVKNLDEHQVKAFLQLLYAMDMLGSVGSSREIRMFVDGDGSFRPEVIVGDEKIRNILDTDSIEKVKEFINKGDDTLSIGGFE